jgi:hypothetical protein
LIKKEKEKQRERERGREGESLSSMYARLGWCPSSPWLLILNIGISNSPPLILKHSRLQEFKIYCLTLMNCFDSK